MDRGGPDGTNFSKDIALALSDVEAVGGFQAKEGCDLPPFK